LRVRRALRSSNEKIKDMEAELNTIRQPPVPSESATVEDITPEDVFSEENSSEGRT
jgi:hypothetical protein